MSDLKLVIKYNVKNDKFEVLGNVEKPDEIVENWIRMQFGKGIDDSENNKQDVYTITISVDLSEDIYTVEHDCGNKGLRDGILMHFLQTYDKQKENGNVD